MNRAKVFGISFVAVEATQASPCGGCATRHASVLCKALPACSSSQREDWRDIVWTTDSTIPDNINQISEVIE